MKNYSTKKRALVTGGAGFLGSHLCDRLLKDGKEVICLDNYFTGRKENIRHLISDQDFELIRHDVSLPIHLEVDEIYNLACPASPPHYQYDPIQTIKTSILGALNMLDLAKRTGAKILQASTSEVYGDPEVHPQKENYWGNVNPVGIRSCYDEGKRCAETLFFDYHRQHNVDIKIVRIFNTYGPRMHPKDGRVISNFILQALKDEDITIYGDGRQTRSFCYVDDLIEGFVRYMDIKESDGRFGFPGPINLGNPSEYTIGEIAETVVKLINSKSKIIYMSLPEDDPKRRQPDINKAAEILKGWAPSIQLDEGLTKTISYFLSTSNEESKIVK